MDEQTSFILLLLILFLVIIAYIYWTKPNDPANTPVNKPQQRDDTDATKSTRLTEAPAARRRTPNRTDATEPTGAPAAHRRTPKLGRTDATELTEKPWRHLEFEWNKDGEKELLQKVRDFSLEGSITKIRILILGQIMAGKTSHLSSFNNVLRQEVASLGNIGNSEESVTKQYRIYQTPMKNGQLNFEYADTMGFDAGRRGMSQRGTCKDDIFYLIKGNIAKGYQFDSKSAIKESNKYFVPEPSLADRPHVVVMVIDSTTVKTMDGHQWDSYKSIRCDAESLEIPMMVVLSKIDMICMHCKEDVKHVFRSTKVEEAVTMVHKNIGVPRFAVLPVSNYHEENNMITNKNILILETLKQVLVQAKTFVETRENDNKESEENDNKNKPR